MNDAFRALGDPTRREILRLLGEGPQTSGAIAERFSSSWPTVSRHLGVLREAGLVLSERQGQQIVYEINAMAVEELIRNLLGWMRPGNGRGPHA